jgi:hypothetical protein
MYQSPNRVVSQDKQAGGRPDRRRLLDLDRDRGAEQAADQLSRRRPGCGIREMLMDDLRDRLMSRVQLTTDGHKAYLQAVEEAFGADIDYSMLIKL